MSTSGTLQPSSPVSGQVAAFVDEVRARLADLDDDVRDELVGGLEADLADQLADGADPALLDDPRGYAAELRAAAGLPGPTRRLPRIDLRHGLDAGRHLDAARGWFLGAVDAAPWSREAWSVVSELRPVWWVGRAWIAVTLLDVVAGPWEPISLLPSLGHPLWGALLLGVAVVLSVLVGRGLWPGSGPHRPAGTRLLTLGLNLLAIVAPLWFGVAAPGYLVGQPVSDYSDVYWGGGRGDEDGAGLRLDGTRVTNVFAYDAAGRPLRRVQLFDQDGDPLSVASGASTGRRDDRTVPCPVLNGAVPLFNVFPLDQATVRRGPCEPSTADPVPAEPPLASVSPLPQDDPAGQRDRGGEQRDRTDDGPDRADQRRGSDRRR